MATAITNDMRERAKKDDKYLVQVALYPKHLSDAAKAKFRHQYTWLSSHRGV